MAEARRIIADQHALIEKLRASKQATLDAERSLQVYASSLKHLEDHERRIRESKPQTEISCAQRPSATEGSLRRNLHSRPVLEIDVGDRLAGVILPGDHLMTKLSTVADRASHGMPRPRLSGSQSHKRGQPRRLGRLGEISGERSTSEMRDESNPRCVVARHAAGAAAGCRLLLPTGRPPAV